MQIWLWTVWWTSRLRSILLSNVFFSDALLSLARTYIYLSFQFNLEKNLEKLML